MKLPFLPKIRGVLVTGTDTDVGKTVIAAGLTAALRRHQVKAVYFKPIQSGCPEDGGRLLPTDAAFARELAGLNEPLELLTPHNSAAATGPGGGRGPGGQAGGSGPHRRGHPRAGRPL